jgi:hypothetical protein
MLPVTFMVFLIAPAVTQVDAADKRHITLRACGAPDDDQLLVMRAADPDPLIEKHLAAGCVDLFAKVAVLFGAETKPVEVRTPHQSLDAYTPPSGGGQDGAYLSVGTVAKVLVWIATPVGEVQAVPGTEVAYHVEQPAEVDSAMHQGLDPVAGAPGQTISTAAVDSRCLVAPLSAREKPPLKPFVWHRTKIPPTARAPPGRAGITAIVSTLDPFSLTV